MDKEAAYIAASEIPEGTPIIYSEAAIMKWEEIFTVQVKIEKAVELHNNAGNSVVMISFSGQVNSELFQGQILDGGIDTQIIGKEGRPHTLSARYMLQGKDYTGESCQIYIENNGEMHSKSQEALFRTYPKIITNSKALSYLNEEILIGEGFPSDFGVNIKIYRWV